MGFKSKATKSNKKKKESRTEPIERTLAGKPFQGVRTDPQTMNAIRGISNRYTRDTNGAVPHIYSKKEIEHYHDGVKPNSTGGWMGVGQHGGGGGAKQTTYVNIDVGIGVSEYMFRYCYCINIYV